MSYQRTPYRAALGLGGRLTPGIKWLLIANFSVYVLQVLMLRLTGARMDALFGLSASDVFHRLYLWQLVTYMFLHSPIWLTHILLNMLMLWMFGTDIERAWGTRLFLKYYFICGIGAGITTILTFPDVPTIGASGALFGIMLAYAMQFPHRQIYLWFLFPMRAWVFVMACAGIELFNLLGLPDGIAHSAHLGGMLVGYLYLKRAWRLREFWREIRWKLRRRRFRVMHQDDEHYPYH